MNTVVIVLAIHMSATLIGLGLYFIAEAIKKTKKKNSNPKR